MNAVVGSQSQAPLTTSEKEALLVLMADEDPSVFAAVRQRILSQGEAGCQWLKPYLLSDIPLLRVRVRSLLRGFASRAADMAFLEFCLKNGGEDLDLEKGCWLLARTRDPEINMEGYQAMLDSFAGSLLNRIDFGAEPEGILADFNQFLFEDLGFRGNEEEPQEPDGLYLNRVVDKRTGGPICMCLIYLFVARRLRLPVAGIGMPDFYLCRFQTSREEIYINAFTQGQLLTKSACIHFLQQTGQRHREDALSPISPRLTLRRLCSELHRAYGELGNSEEQARVERYVIALSR